jgi:para-aminobenzoate synthetase component 1
MSFTDFVKKVNHFGAERIPFLFLIDFEMKKPRLWKLDDIDSTSVLFDFNGVTNNENLTFADSGVHLEVTPVSLSDYKNRFDRVMKHLEYGDSYLTNLTIRSEISVSSDLRELFYKSSAKYKLLLDDGVLVFSPEIFVQIRDGKIYSFPMKGTIDATLPDARNKLLIDPKEIAEHVTIVDLIRNDLSIVSDNVHVARFRYVDEIQTHGKKLLQVSSEVVGQLGPNHFSDLGNIIAQLLPAGSVSGAPKPKTVEIIRQAEGVDRGYYTGVSGIFDGNSLDSGVMIRYIEKENEKLYYRSGGGITTQSNLEAEYQEAIDKIYVPLY